MWENVDKYIRTSKKISVHRKIYRCTEIYCCALRKYCSALRKYCCALQNIYVRSQTLSCIAYMGHRIRMTASRARNNANYEFSCPGCGHSYIGKTERSLETRLSEHANINSYKTSAITQHLLNCPDALYLANLNTFSDLDSSEEFSDKMHCPTALAYTNSKILYSCKYNNPNQLLILEALLIKRKLPELNCGLKASKQLSLFL